MLVSTFDNVTCFKTALESLVLFNCSHYKYESLPGKELTYTINILISLRMNRSVFAHGHLCIKDWVITKKCVTVHLACYYTKNVH